MNRLFAAIVMTIGLYAEAYAYDSGVHLPVYSYAKSAQALHVREFVPSSRPDNAAAPALKWDFPASYTGHRSVCWLPGATTNMAFVAWVGGDEWQPGDPFGFTPAASPSNTQAIALTRVSAVTPRLKLWTESGSDRNTLFGESAVPTNVARRIIVNPAGLPLRTRIRVVRYLVDDRPVWKVGTDAEVIFDKTFEKDVRDFIHEGDFLADGKFDIDWDLLESEVYDNYVVADAALEVTNMTYAIVVGDGDVVYYSDTETAHTVYAHPYMIQRRFEVAHTPPTIVSVGNADVARSARPTFRWRIEGEDKWASAFGTTYTAFRIKVWDSSSVEVYDSGLQRMPPLGAGRVYSWTPPTDIVSDGETYTWRVFTYNAKFKTDDGSSNHGDMGSTTNAFTTSFGNPPPVSACPSGIYLPVYSYTRSDQPIHVRTMSEDVFTDEKEWTFPATYTGHRSVCWLPGSSSNTAFVAWVGGDEWQPGDPFGFTPAASPSNTQAIALTRVSAVAPRLKLWTESGSDRNALLGESAVPTNVARRVIVNPVGIPQRTRVRVVRHVVDSQATWNVSTEAEVIFDKMFEKDVRDFIHEGDCLGDGKFDIDWDKLESEVCNNVVIRLEGLNVTNMTYAIVIGDGDIEYYSDVDNAHTVYAHPYMITRRFEVAHTPPTAVSCATNSALATFAWRIEGEDKWASAFGTTYKAFRVRVYDASTNVLHDTGYRRMPPAGMDSTYRWTAPAEWLADRSSWSTWRVFTYNAKFKTDDVGSAAATFTP